MADEGSVKWEEWTGLNFFHPRAGMNASTILKQRNVCHEMNIPIMHSSNVDSAMHCTDFLTPLACSPS